MKLDVVNAQNEKIGDVELRDGEKSPEFLEGA